MNEAVNLQGHNCAKIDKFRENFENMANLILESDKTDIKLGNPSQPSFLASLFFQECSIGHYSGHGVKRMTFLPQNFICSELFCQISISF